ncbi:nuclear transport factor 2 family protein [Streptomyces brasiliscabiei]|uniref:nuclear transport factor 2 family protein n=1 Tax=Streptomyces brasiliscabiei TaxID=2736302 RepID=UPI0038F6516A
MKRAPSNRRRRPGPGEQSGRPTSAALNPQDAFVHPPHPSRRAERTPHVHPRHAPAVLQFFRASQKRDADTWSGAFAEDALYCDPVGTPPLEGRAAVHDLVVSVITGFEPLARADSHRGAHRR